MGSLYGANLALEYPEYYEAFIGVGQFIDPLENEQRLYNAALEWSVGDEEGQTVLSGWSPDNEDSVEALQARNATLERYGYGMMKDGTDYNIFTTVLFNPNYTIKDYSVEQLSQKLTSLLLKHSIMKNNSGQCEMKYDANINGLDIRADFSEETINSILVPLLTTLAEIHSKKQDRVIAMLAAPPGAGKSSLWLK